MDNQADTQLGQNGRKFSFDLLFLPLSGPSFNLELWAIPVFEPTSVQGL
jgi:hypothetical protein